MKHITIAYFWNDDPAREIWQANAAIGEHDGVSDDSGYFYWFEPGDRIVGDHGEFTVTDYEENV